jgi:hypothetical protein
VTFTSLEIDGAKLTFMIVQRTASNARNILSINDRDTILHNRKSSTYKGDIEALPYIGFTRGSGVGLINP